MTKLRSVTAGLLATAMLATSAAPAMAQGYPGGYSGGWGRPGYDRGWDRRHWDRRHHRRHNDNTGAVVAGVIGVGILAAIIASAASANRNQNRVDNRFGGIRTDDAAADACAVAAEQQFGQGARTRAIDSVTPVSDGFNVRGVVALERSGFSGRDSREFSCSVRFGEVQRVDFGGFAERGF